METKQKQVAINLNVETTPILYTDNIFMTTNEDGVTLEVGQKILASDQVKIVTRVGMSRNHAKKFIAELSKLLAVTEGQTQSGQEKKN